ncbi:hypothetical protein C8J57DRAFT_21670 [Mycena rebaudengoi]|nr:hypothetical protein C8J57DRAFT_21670 [Mycena rebaudengoi]
MSNLAGRPLHLSSFTLDEFEHAIRHSAVDIPCSMLAEIHSTLIYNLRTVPFQRHSALVSLLRLKDLVEDEAEVGNNWERVPLRHSEGRDGWEDAVFGCLKDHATLINFPTLREVLTRLLFAPDSHVDPCSSSSGSSRVSSPVSSALVVISNPAERYYTLPAADRIAILSFMSNLAISSKAVHGHIEYCEEQLTALRKEKIEVNRLKKQHAEEMNILRIEAKEDPLPAPTNGVDQDVVMLDSSDLSDVSGSDSAPKKGSSRAKGAKTGLGKQREAARRQSSTLWLNIVGLTRRSINWNAAWRALSGSLENFCAPFVSSLLGRTDSITEFGGLMEWAQDRWWAVVVLLSMAPGGFSFKDPEFDTDLLAARTDEGIEERRKEEEGVEGMLGPGDWAVYSDQEELDEFMAWLNPKGHREIALKTVLTKWWPHITSGLRRRVADVNVNARLPEARRSTRTKSAVHDISREPYMMWTNRKATTVVAQ